MKIETKYNVGDTVYILNDNTIQQLRIATVDASINDQSSSVYYGFHDFSSSRLEDAIFANKEEVLAYLTKNIKLIHS